MARQPRFRIPGIAQHVVQRGNNRKACFFVRPDYLTYIRFLSEALQSADCSLHAFVLMTNHVHLLITPSSASGIPKLMQSLGRRYVQHVNRRHGRTGTLWEGRYRSTVVDDDDHLLAVYRYIELNPVRAHMVERPGRYPWSSYQANVSGAPGFPVVAHATYMALGHSKSARARAYGQLFEDGVAGREDDWIRKCTRKAWPLGTGTFHERIEAMTGRRIVRNGWGGARAVRVVEDGTDDSGVPGGPSTHGDSQEI